MCKSIIPILILFIPLACLAGSEDSFWGTYQGMSRACHSSFIVLDKDKVSIDECEEASYTTIESDSEHILMEVKPSQRCRWRLIRIERENKPDYGGIVVKTYDNPKGALKDNYNLYCVYEQVDPSLAKDQTERFLNAKTGKERKDALHKINLQERQDRDEYNEIGLRDPSPEVRIIAAFFLRGNPDHFVPMLINVIASDPDARVRGSAGASLTHFYTDNGSDGYLHVEPLENNLEKLLSGLENLETLGSIVEILGGRPAGDSILSCYMSAKSREKAVIALNSPLKKIQLAREAFEMGLHAQWHNSYSELKYEIPSTIEKIKECPTTEKGRSQ